MLQQKRIEFFRETDAYGEFCNFYPSPIEYCKKTYPTVEHLYQARRYIFKDAPSINNEYAEVIRTSSTPYKAKLLANQFIFRRYPWQQKLSKTIEDYKQRGIQMREDWDEVCVEVMLEALRLKFKTSEHCREVLLSTRGKELAERSGDSFWGTGDDDKGENMLGKLLMQVRDELEVCKDYAKEGTATLKHSNTSKEAEKKSNKRQKTLHDFKQK